MREFQLFRMTFTVTMVIALILQPAFAVAASSCGQADCSRDSLSRAKALNASSAENCCTEHSACCCEARRATDSKHQISCRCGKPAPEPTLPKDDSSDSGSSRLVVSGSCGPVLPLSEQVTAQRPKADKPFFSLPAARGLCVLHCVWLT